MKIGKAIYFAFILIPILVGGCTNKDSDDKDEISTDLELGNEVFLGNLPEKGDNWNLELYSHGAKIYGVIFNKSLCFHTTSADDGENWLLPETELKMSTLGVYGNTIYRQSRVGNGINLYSSLDGKTWNEKVVFTFPENTDSESNTQYTGVVAENGDIWFAIYYKLKESGYSDYELVIMKSVNKGVTFEQNPARKASDYFPKTFINMTVSGKYAAINCSYDYGRHGGESMLISSDGGDTFEEVMTNNFSRSAVDSGNPLKVYYCRYGENAPYSWTYTFHRTSDFGKTCDIKETCDPCKLLFRNNRLLARLDKKGVRQSNDEGVTWSEYFNVTGSVEKEYSEMAFVEREDKKLLFMWIHNSCLYVRKER